MTVGSLITSLGKNAFLYRAYTPNNSLSSTSNTAPLYFQLGVSNQTPAVTDTALLVPIPILHGLVLDKGNNILTGSGGGDNSTSNPTTYKVGANQTDNTSQNLIGNATLAAKTWSGVLTTFGDASQYVGFWLYIKDAAALLKFKAGTCVELRVGSDASNYFSKGWLKTGNPLPPVNLAVGWNWLCSNLTLGNLTQTGIVTGNIDYFCVIITTTNATDTFIAGDVIFDLLRQYSALDCLKTFQTGYPSFDTTDKEVTIRCHLPTVYANGYSIDGLGIFNEDTTKKLSSEDTFTAQSKSTTDEFIFIITDRYV